MLQNDDEATQGLWLEGMASFGRRYQMEKMIKSKRRIKSAGQYQMKIFLQKRPKEKQSGCEGEIGGPAETR